MTVKVLFINQTSRLGGAEKVLKVLIENLDKNRISPILASPGGELQQSLSKKVKWIEVKEFEELETTRKKFKGHDLLTFYKLHKKINTLIETQKPHIVVSNSVKAHVIVNLFKRNVPSMIRLHDFPQSFSGISKLILKRALSKTNHVSCVSYSVAEDLERLLSNRKKISVTYNGFNENEYESTFHFERPRIVMAGWLLQWKGFHIYIEAMERIADLIPEWDFVIAGDVAPDAEGSKEYSDFLKEKVATSKYSHRFIWYGRYKTFNELICCPNHSIFVQSSIKHDPLPTVLFEAAACKIPVVSSNLGGSKEIILDGETGCLIPPTADDIAGKVLALANNEKLRNEYGYNFYKRYKDKFNIDSYVNGITLAIEKEIGT